MAGVHILIKGKVQRVFFRATAKEKADELSITGWVKNTQDGDVEIAASGSGEQLKQFIDWCKRGPARAEVTGITISSADHMDFQDFKVIR
jgi:acylphosphatase